MAELINKGGNAPGIGGESQQGPEGPARGARPAVGEVHLRPPDPKGRKASGAGRDLFDYGKAVLEILGLAVLCIYTAYTVRIWRANRRAADAAVQSANATRDAMKADQRAWVGLASAPQVVATSLEPGKFRASIGLVLKNFGKGPALKVMTDERIVTSQVDDNLQSSCNLVFPFVGLKPSLPVVASDKNAFGRQWGNVIFPDQQFSAGGNYQDSSSVTGKEAYVIGCIVYEDQFGEPHWTRFCYNTGDFATEVVRDSSSFRHLYACSRNNYTDDSERK